jgi:DNA-binding transcriptional MocR family regulator
MNGAPDIEIVLGPWSAGGGRLHTKLAAAFRRAIERRVLAPGIRLPSERELSRQLLVSRSTVVAAYDSLRAEGLLDSRRGSGTRVARLPGAGPTGVDTPLNPVYRSLLADEAGDVFSLACAINPAHRAVADAITEVASEAPASLLRTSGYLPLGVPELRSGLAEFHTRAGLPTATEQVVVTTGAQQAVNLCAALFVRPGDRVVVESPSFAGTLDAFRAMAVEFVAVEVDDGGADVRGVRTALQREAPTLVFLMPSFHNPTGVMLARGRRVELAELAATSGIPLVEDNALELTPLAVDPVPSVAAFGPPDAPIVTIGSFSKLAWGGLRVGWLRAPEPLARRLGEVKARADLGTPMFDQVVAARLLDRVDEMREDRRSHLLAALDLTAGLLDRHLPEWRWRRPDGGPSLWVRLPHGSAAAYAQAALRHGVEVIPGDVMSPTGGHADHLRLPFTAPPEVLEGVIRRLADAWDVYASGGPERRPAPAVVV